MEIYINLSINLFISLSLQIPSSVCLECGGVGRYNASLSKSLIYSTKKIQNFSVSYGSGEATGWIAKETVRLGYIITKNVTLGKGDRF